MAVNDGDLTVVLDTNLTPELLEEGFVREVISKLQTMRKEAGFEVTDHIRVTYQGSEKAAAYIAENCEEVAHDVLAESVQAGVPEDGAYAKEWNVNGEDVLFGVAKI